MRTTLQLTSLVLAVAVLGGCAVAGAGAALLNGAIPTQTSGGQPSAAPSGAPTAINKASAGKAVERVDVSQPTMRIEAKKSVKAQATVRYLDGSTDNDIQWSTKDATIVVVNATTGEVTGQKAGTATIYARAAADPDNKFSIINVTVAQGVTEDLYVEITPKKKTIGLKETVKLNASVTDSNTETSPNGSWESSNKKVAAVNASGIVTGLSAGKATITFTSDLSPEINDSATITVTDGSDEEAAAE